MSEEQEKRGPGRPPKPVTAEVIYNPLDAGDPHTTEWNGITFKANVPLVLNYETHGDMIATARGNPHFSVDGKSHKRVRPDRLAIPMPGSDIDPVAVDDKRMVEAD